MSKINILEALRVSLTSIKNYINENYYNTSKIDELLNEKADTDDLPCYDTREYEYVTLTYDGNKGTKEVLDVVPGEASFVKITDNISINDLESLSTADVTICMFNSDGQTEEYTINVADSGGCEFVQENIYRAAESFILLVLEDTDFSGIDIAKGIWFMHVNESSLSYYYPKSLTYNTCISGELKKLDEKFIPDTIARINDLPSKEYVDNEILWVGDNLQGQIDDLFQNVSNGKELIASAITDKGIDASEDETFQELADKISSIIVGPPGSTIVGYVDEENDIYISQTEVGSGTYILKYEDQNGILTGFDDIGNVEVE